MMSEETTPWAGELEAEIRGAPEGRAVDRVVVLGEVSSTQDSARELCAGDPGLLVVCDVQTGGRGRLGRVWCDTPGKSLAMSAVLDARRFDPGFVSLASGLAIARAGAQACNIERLGLRWPNDVVDPISGRKIAGVLIERSGDLLVVGMGINISQRDADWPDELRGGAVSLGAIGSRVTRIGFARLLLAELERTLASSPASLCEAWGARDVLVGTRRTFISDGQRWTGVVRSISPMSEIVIEDSLGARRTLAAATTSLEPGAPSPAS